MSTEVISTSIATGSKARLAGIAAVMVGGALFMTAPALAPATETPIAVEKVYVEQRLTGPAYIAVGMNSEFETQTAEVDLLTFDRVMNGKAQDVVAISRQSSPWAMGIRVVGVLVGLMGIALPWRVSRFR